MINQTELTKLIDQHVKRVLDYGALAVPTDKFPLFRTLVLDEFGHNGLRKELAELLPKDGQSGK